jgi:periplasmic divalent cation tolerance protein
MDTADCLEVHTTTPDRQTAEAIAALLVERRLAACAQVSGPITSLFHWQGKIERSEEWVCRAKTRGDRYPALEAAIREAHPYDVPEIIALPIVAGNPDYLEWVRTESREQGT